MMYLRLFFMFVVILHIMKQVNGIIGGQPANKHNWAHMVVIAYKIDLLCSGTIIMPNWVLTAARCVDPRYTGGKTLIGVRVGVLDLNSTQGKIIPYKSKFIHPNYLVHRDSGSTVNDIGLIKLAGYMTFTDQVHAVTLSFERPMINTTCVTAGWGINNISAYTAMIKDRAELFTKPRILREIKQTLISIEDCRDARRVEVKGALDADFHACSRTSYEDSDNETGPSFGDYGGPLICNGEQMAIAGFGIYDPDYSPVHMMAWTWLGRHLSWLDKTVTESNAKDSPKYVPPSPSKRHQEDFWQDLDHSASGICIFLHTLTCCFVLISNLLRMLIGY